MNLQELFKIQAKLDERIIQEHGLEGQNLLDKKILALQVELGELGQNWRGFKFWSTDKEPRTEVSTGICLHCSGTGNEFYDDETMEWEDCPYCEDGEIVKNPLLEEYVDCLHFILSIGLELNYADAEVWVVQEKIIVNQFIELQGKAYNIQFLKRVSGDVGIESYENLIAYFIGLGEMLGFTWEQIEQAYMDKNKINHERQNTGY